MDPEIHYKTFVLRLLIYLLRHPVNPPYGSICQPQPELRLDFLRSGFGNPRIVRESFRACLAGRHHGGGSAYNKTSTVYGAFKGGPGTANPTQLPPALNRAFPKLLPYFVHLYVLYANKSGIVLWMFPVVYFD